MSFIESVARQMTGITAKLPASVQRGVDFAVPILCSDPDFDDLPLDHTQGTVDDEITRAAVLKLVRETLAFVRDNPTEEMMVALARRGGCINDPEAGWKAAFDAILGKDAP